MITAREAFLLAQLNAGKIIQVQYDKAILKLHKHGNSLTGLQYNDLTGNQLKETAKLACIKSGVCDETGVIL